MSDADSNNNQTAQEPPTITTMECGAAISSNQMAAFLASFQQSARRWEIIVYPALFAFIVLAMYGFFLIYSLTNDMARISASIDPEMGQHMTTMSESIKDLSVQMRIMSKQMGEVSAQMQALEPMLTEMQTIATEMQALKPMLQEMRGINNQIVSLKPILQEMQQLSIAVGGMRDAVGTMSNTMQNMDDSMAYMAVSTNHMRHNMTVLNHSIARPLSYLQMFPFF